jgi:hypothetical protein
MHPNIFLAPQQVTFSISVIPLFSFTSCHEALWNTSIDSLTFNCYGRIKSPPHTIVFLRGQILLAVVASYINFFSLFSPLISSKERENLLHYWGFKWNRNLPNLGWPTLLSFSMGHATWSPQSIHLRFGTSAKVFHTWIFLLLFNLISIPSQS